MIQTSEGAKKQFLSNKGLRKVVWRLFSLPPLVLEIVLYGVALGFNFYRLGAPSIWFDEAFSVELARQPLPLLWHIIFGPEPNMELYYLFLHYWLGFTQWLGFNPTEFVVRFPSAIFASLSTVVVFLLGRRFLGTFVGVVGASLYLLNDLQLVYAQQTRSYSLQLLLTCLAWYALLMALTSESHQKRRWLAYIVTITLAVYAHLFSLLILLAQVVAVVGVLVLPGQWRDQARKQFVASLISLLAVGVLIIPMLLESLQGAKTDWLPVPHLHDLANLFFTIGGGDKPYVYAFVGCAILGVTSVLFSYGLVHLSGIRRPRLEHHWLGKMFLSSQQRFPMLWLLLCWLIVPLVVSYVVSQGATRLFSSRYLVVILPPLFLLIGLGIATMRWRALRVGLAISVILLALWTVPSYYKSAQVEDWNSTAHWLEEQFEVDDGLVCYDSALEQGCQVSIEYYLDAYPSLAHFTDDSPGAFSWENFGPANPKAGTDAAVDPTALAAYGAKHPRLFFIVGRVADDAGAARAQAAQQWLDSNYHFVGQIVTRTVTIRLYQTT